VVNSQLERRARRERAAAELLLGHLAGGPTRAYANAKRLLNRTLYPDFAGQLDAEAEAQREQGQSAGLHRGRAGVCREAPAALHRRLRPAAQTEWQARKAPSGS
jgi:hypothetical protein